MRKIITSFCLIFFTTVVYAQDNVKKDTLKTASDSVRNTFQFLDGAPVNIDLETKNEEEEESVQKKEKKKKNFFYDKKTRKAYLVSGVGSGTKELFNVLKKEWVNPDPYIRDFYWFDYRRKTIRSNKSPDPKFAGILHGPYQKIKDDMVIESGMYWNGLKHGRWMRFDKNGILLDKLVYFKGWPIESEITYYDQERAQVKEVIPIEYGEKEGTYLFFHKNGQIAVQGEFRFDNKVGLWVEFYDNRRRRKKTIQYGKDPFDTSFLPYINQEWNTAGKQVYDRSQWERKFTSN
ncbi:MAG: antitoxin component YwqK of YwqJK toxin-antitoxin module [Marivirga sp.]|jgi:antitoxin component YwqK of YwqJK toxin-antitoxin module